jgi:hypothetical protein
MVGTVIRRQLFIAIELVILQIRLKSCQWYEFLLESVRGVVFE